MLTKQDLDRLRAIVDRETVEGAAKVLGVHKTSVIRALAKLPLRPRTERDLKAALAKT